MAKVAELALAVSSSIVKSGSRSWPQEETDMLGVVLVLPVLLLDSAARSARDPGEFDTIVSTVSTQWYWARARTEYQYSPCKPPMIGVCRQSLLHQDGIHGVGQVCALWMSKHILGRVLNTYCI